MKKTTLEVKGWKIEILSQRSDDFINLTDIGRVKDSEPT